MDRVSELLAAQPEGMTLLADFYLDPEVYSAELERLVFPNWWVVGHTSEWREPGDFRLFELAGESVILVRGDDGELRAFANVCRHRGSRVCLESDGNTQRFSCPYHGWQFGREGQLLAARSMPADFDKTEWGLKPVAVENLHGVVLVCLAGAPPSIDDARRDLAAPMRAFDFERLTVAARRDWTIPANWKITVENYQECYHCSAAHPEYARMHTLTVDYRRRDQLQTSMREKLLSAGLPDVEYAFSDYDTPDGQMGYHYSRTAMFDGYLTGSRDGKPVAPLLGNLTGYDGGASDFTFGPFSFMLAYSDHIVCYVFKPIDLTRSSCEVTWYVRDDAEPGRDYDLDALTWLWDVTMDADKTIIKDTYAGVRSRFYEPGVFSMMERMESNYVRWVLRELGRVA
ncbi:MAG: aromatic ring-hydroxylating dioxygenase subunit alpha [Pseudomonadota bacterium]